MNRKTILIILLVVVCLVVLGFLAKTFILDKRINAFSGVRVDSIPEAEVYLNNKMVGKTPYENAKLAPGEYELRLSVSGTSGVFFPWETKIKLLPQSLTYVNRTIGKNDSESGHQIVWLEKIADPNAKELAVVSSPDNATIVADGLDEGVTSKIITNLSAGDHQITVSKEGYSDQVIDGKLVPGYRLNISVKLAKADQDLELPPDKIATESAKLATSSAKPASGSGSTTSNPPTPYIVVLDTGLGFLRVRVGPTAAATESGRVNVGEKFPLMAEESGWTQIKVGTSSGWVSDQYIEKFK